MYQSHSSFVCSKRKKRCPLVNGNDYGNRKLYEDEKACFWSLTKKKGFRRKAVKRQTYTMDFICKAIPFLFL